MAEPRISVIVPVRDGARSLPALLDALEAQTLPRGQFEVVVVDNASRDQSGAIARAAGARVVDEPRPNRARARNRGAAVTRAPRLAFTDADCVPEPSWLAALLEGLDRWDTVAGPVRLLTATPPNRYERLEMLWRFEQERHVAEGGWAATANLAVRRGAFEAVGGFDPAYRHIGEDADYCLRARRRGSTLGWCPDAIVAHAAECELRPILRRAFMHGYSSTQHHRRFAGELGWRFWRHPRPALTGDWALRRFDRVPRGLDAQAHRGLLRLARLEYAGRVAGSAWAELRRVR